MTAWRASWRRQTLLSIALLLSCVQAVTVENVTIIGAQTDSRLNSVSRDGGVSVILNGKVLWLFDDTTVSSNVSGELVEFSSNSAALAVDPNKVTALEDVSQFSAGAIRAQAVLASNAASESGSWIPLSSSEQVFNQKQASGERLAIWPGTAPLAGSPAVAYLWAPVVQVSNGNNEHPRTTQQTFTYQYTALVQIRGTKSGLAASRLVDSLFAANDERDRSGQFAPFGCFASIVGKASNCYDAHLSKCMQRSIYLLGATGNGVQLARLPLRNVGKSEDVYEFWQPGVCNFSALGDTSKLSMSSKSYLSGSFSSGSVFYSPFFKTFLLLYMNTNADSTFYLRYLDLNVTSCTSNDTVWQKGGIDGQGITMEDAEAIIHFKWSEPQVLYQTPVPTNSNIKYNYAGMAHPEYFNRQYYQRWMYSNGGVDSTMRSPWLGHDIVTEADSGGDGKHLMLSWTTSGSNGFEIMMAKVEFGEMQENSAQILGHSIRMVAALGAACILLMG